MHVNESARFTDRLPYVAAVVDLEEGPRVMTNVVDCDPADLRIGMALRVVFREATDDISVPVFVPAYTTLLALMPDGCPAAPQTPSNTVPLEQTSLRCR